MMNAKMKETAISSVVCIDIIDFPNKSVAEQQEAKLQLAARINHAVFDIPENDRAIIDTEQGAIITCSGPLEGALEDALFIALTIRDEVLSKNIDGNAPLYLLIAINLGAARSEADGEVKGEGLSEAQQIMSFANPNQILVSRTYYDMASKLTLEVAQMFEKYDMHAYEHDIYAVRRLNEKSVVENAAAALDHLERPQEEAPIANTFNWQIYFLPTLLALIMIIVLFKWMQHDRTEDIQNGANVQSPVVDVTDDTNNFDIDMLPDPLPEIPPEPETDVTKIQEAGGQENTKKAAKKVQQKPVSKPVVEEETTTVTADQVQEDDAILDSSDDGEKSTWDAIKDSVTSGSEQPCTQAQRAMNQCN